jgi:hypothetical protein
MKGYFYNGLIYFIVFVKVIFIILSLLYLHYERKGDVKKAVEIEYWRTRAEFIFTASMALLLIYLFYPGKKIVVDSQARMLLYLFGWVLLITADWKQFINQSKWFTYIQGIIGLPGR